MGYASISPLRTGWTGTIAATYNSITTTVTPETRDSPAAVMARLVHQTYVDSGLVLSLSVSSTGVITISGSATFSLAATSNTATYTGFSTHSSAATYTASGASSGAWVPTYGLRLEGTTLATGEGRVTSDGGTSSTSGLVAGASTRLMLWTSHADAWGNEDVSGVVDVWHDGRIFGRVRIDAFTRTPLGRQRNTSVPYLLTAQCTAVDPEEVRPSIPASWPTASAWLYSWVRTDHPGYRQIRIAGATYTITSGTYRWDDFIAQIGTDTAAAAGQTSIGSDGRVTIQYDTAVAAWPDRLGWLLGMGKEAGTSEASSAELISRFVPPGGIPLFGVTWTEVRVEREREQILDRSRRQSGYVFGGARVWRCVLRMTRWALEALQTGWCLRGKITLVGSVSSAMSSTVPGGALTGVALHLEGAPAWDDSTQQTCTVTMLVAGALT